MIETVLYILIPQVGSVERGQTVAPLASSPPLPVEQLFGLINSVPR